MCSMYWTVKDVKFTCPACGVDGETDVQTHFMGEPGSCLNRYKIGDSIPECVGITASLGSLSQGYPDDFIGDCPNCNALLDFAGRIEEGVLEDVWPYGFQIID